jgi:bifunctional UDP-N-acetylglucosamine pyrophosphorylase/glucosamine-1-phosphate N-acetyltransferase
VGEAPDLAYAEQKERLGTGHALLQARGACGDGAGTILVLPGDQPLMSEAMLRALVERHHAAGAAVTLLTAALPDATG